MGRSVPRLEEPAPEVSIPALSIPRGRRWISRCMHLASRRVIGSYLRVDPISVAPRASRRTIDRRTFPPEDARGNTVLDGRTRALQRMYAKA